METFRGCTALITGASSGLGQEMARQLAPHAGRLVLLARRADRLEELRAELAGHYEGLDVKTYAIDLASDEQFSPMLDWLRENGLRVDFLINNAGLGDHGPFETSDWEKVRRILAVNVVALTRLTHALLPSLRAHSCAQILNVSSIAGLLPIPNLSVYAATKSYVNSFSESIRAELRGTGVGVTTVCPGPFDTEFRGVAEREGGDEMPAPHQFKLSCREVAHQALRAAAKDKARVIPGWMVALVMTVAASVPLFVLRYFMGRQAARSGRSED
jgi:short-subunit dehydrogenase